MKKGFKQPEVRVRTFEVELKHREPEDVTGEHEILIATEQIKIPNLHNRKWEKRWVMCSVWNNFSNPEAKELGINQAFIFTKDFKQLVIRLEVNLFQDEQAEILEPPRQDAHEEWLNQVRKQFKKLYGYELAEWEKIRCEALGQKRECTSSDL